jgi:hypothetical protein
LLQIYTTQSDLTHEQQIKAKLQEQRDAVKLLLHCRLVRDMMAFCSFHQDPGTNAIQEDEPATLSMPEEGAHTSKN